MRLLPVDAPLLALGQLPMLTRTVRLRHRTRVMTTMLPSIYKRWAVPVVLFKDRRVLPPWLCLLATQLVSMDKR